MWRVLAVVLLVGCDALFGIHELPGDAPSASIDRPSGADAMPDAMPDAPICTAVTAPTCSADGNDLLQCAAIGAEEMVTACGWGCATATSPHCAVLAPTGGFATTTDTTSSAFAGLGGFVIASSTVINTAGSGAITNGSGVYSTRTEAGVPIFHFGSSLTITGAPTFTGSSPVVFVVDGPISINAVLDVSVCGDGSAGLGGAAGGAPGANGHTFSAIAAQGGGGSARGGGGGAYGGDGGSGGTDTGANTNGGGQVYGNAQIATLVGGGGGAGGGSNTDLAYGGNGGGAIQLISNTGITLGAAAGINAGGCGGDNSANASDGAGGGGAGGAIVIEAPTITFASATVLAVNGGAGGGIAQGNNDPASAGLLGSASATNASGGGSGGAGSTASGGDGASNVNSAGGGGGGAVGWMRFNTRGGTLSTSSATLSPPLGTGTTCTHGSASVM